MKEQKPKKMPFGVKGLGIGYWGSIENHEEEMTGKKEKILSA